MSQTPSIDAVLERMQSYGDRTAVHYCREEMSYTEFLQLVSEWETRLRSEYQITPGKVVAVLGEFSPNVCATFFALMRLKAIIVPFTMAIKNEIPELISIGKVQCQFTFDPDDRWTFEDFGTEEVNDLVAKFRERDLPGLIVFTSGSTGKKKGILHDCERVMKKFVDERKGWKTSLFLMMDHFGGFNTFLSAFAYGGVAVCLQDRQPDSVCETIEQSGADLLPTTPTFLNLLLASRCYLERDISSIELISYGTEVMSGSTLDKLRQIFPKARLKQTYGLSELGVVRSRSKGDSSLMLKIGGSGFEVKVIDNMLWIRSEANMIGYLNAPNPIQEDGWMCTGDQVEVEGDYMRIIGRKSDMINVGGQKVFPVEVENVLLSDENVKDAAVFAAKHPVMGQVVHTKILLNTPEKKSEVLERLRALCMKRLTKFKVPVKFIIEASEGVHNERFKKVRRSEELTT